MQVFRPLCAIIIVVATTLICCAADMSPESSYIVRLFDTAERDNGGHIDLSRYQRPDMIGYIYEGKFGFVPGHGLDNLRYFVQVVSELNNKCPSLNLEEHKYELIPYLTSGSIDLYQRFREGRLSSSELAQAAWMAMLSFNERGACHFNPNSGQTLQEAQDQCDAAGAQTNALSIMPSVPASADINLFLQRHSCKSAEARRFANNLVAFAREAPAQSTFADSMPPPNSAAGQSYMKIFNNCSRSSIDPANLRWCSCYVRTLSALSPSTKVLDGLANNPFVDGGTYMDWVVSHVTGAASLYDCADSSGNLYKFRENRAPRSTACLMEKSPSNSTCRYRAAWGEFIVTKPECASEITSKSWGWREVDCGAGRDAASSAPRQWRQGRFTHIDYEQDVPPDFVPELPPGAMTKWPIQVRFLARTKPAQLKSMSLVKIGSAELQLPMDLEFNKDTGKLLGALFKKGSFVLTCEYLTLDPSHVWETIYWYLKVPEDVAEGKVSPALAPYFAKIGSPLKVCPAQRP